MTDDDINKLAAYVQYLRGRMDVYHAEGNEKMCEYIGAKLEAVREICVIFDCREEVFGRADRLED